MRRLRQVENGFAKPLVTKIPMSVYTRPPAPFRLKTALLWVTYGKDIQFFEASLRSYQKFASGFTYTKVIVPNGDVPAFKSLCDPVGVTVAGIDEPPGKGMLMHMAMQMLGETHFPGDADFIFHIDADCVFNQPTTPLDYLPGDKPMICFRDWDTLLTRPVGPDEIETFMGFTGRKIDFNRGSYLWKFAADFALGFASQRQTMSMMPVVHRRETYLQAREIIEHRFHTDIISHVLNGRNEWPQSFCEFETLGSVAHRYFGDRYHWHELDKQNGYPAVHVTQTWSHGGLDSREECGRPQIIAGIHCSPREYFQSLGVI